MYARLVVATDYQLKFYLIRAMRWISRILIKCTVEIVPVKF